MGNSEWTPGVDMSLSGEVSRLRRENEALRKAAQSGAPPLTPEGFRAECDRMSAVLAAIFAQTECTCIDNVDAEQAGDGSWHGSLVRCVHCLATPPYTYPQAEAVAHLARASHSLAPEGIDGSRASMAARMRTAYVAASDAGRPQDAWDAASLAALAWMREQEDQAEREAFAAAQAQARTPSAASAASAPEGISAHVAVCGPVSETEAKAIGSMIAGAAKMMAGAPGDCAHPVDQLGVVCAVCETWLDEPAIAADVVEIHAETILRVVGYCLSDGPRSALADCGAVLAFVAKATA